MLGMIVLILLVLMFFGALPAWPHSHSWGYAPSGALGTVVLVANADDHEPVARLGMPPFTDTASR